MTRPDVSNPTRQEITICTALTSRLIALNEASRNPKIRERVRDTKERVSETMNKSAESSNMQPRAMRPSGETWYLSDYFGDGDYNIRRR